VNRVQHRPVGRGAVLQQRNLIAQDQRFAAERLLQRQMAVQYIGRRFLPLLHPRNDPPPLFLCKWAFGANKTGAPPIKRFRTYELARIRYGATASADSDNGKD